MRLEATQTRAQPLVSNRHLAPPEALELERLGVRNESVVSLASSLPYAVLRQMLISRGERGHPAGLQQPATWNITSVRALLCKSWKRQVIKYLHEVPNPPLPRLRQLCGVSTSRIQITDGNVSDPKDWYSIRTILPKFSRL